MNRELTVAILAFACLAEAQPWTWAISSDTDVYSYRYDTEWNLLESHHWSGSIPVSGLGSRRSYDEYFYTCCLESPTVARVYLWDTEYYSYGYWTCEGADFTDLSGFDIKGYYGNYGGSPFDMSWCYFGGKQSTGDSPVIHEFDYNYIGTHVIDTDGSTRGLSFNRDCDTLFTLVLDSSGTLLSVYGVELASWQYELLFGPAAIPSGASTIYDCSEYEGHLYFGVSDGASHPVWEIDLAAQTMNPVTELDWSDVSSPIKGIDVYSLPTGIDDPDGPSPAPGCLRAGPNPFMDNVIIQSGSSGTLMIFDLCGRPAVFTPFSVSYTWDASQMSSGVYFAILESPEGVSAPLCLVKL
ncbi:MAG: T9SS type A sorting domain-containing protein [Candidatus Fermentibacter sp.]|nr:T9SS type A sorting domain-containing protein [Candidatus Fermentibacter sp.]